MGILVHAEFVLGVVWIMGGLWAQATGADGTTVSLGQGAIGIGATGVFAAALAVSRDYWLDRQRIREAEAASRQQTRDSELAARSYEIERLKITLRVEEGRQFMLGLHRWGEHVAKTHEGLPPLPPLPPWVDASDGS